MILAAGLGTRLRPLTDLAPKPLVPVGDRPMLAHVVDAVRAAGCEPVVANAFHHADEVERFCAGVGVAVSREHELLGTAGGITAAAARLGHSDVLVHNGDVLVSLDLGGLMATHRARGAAATLAVVPRPAGEGNIGVGKNGQIVRIRTISFAEGEIQGGLFTGVHFIGPRMRAELPAKGCVVGDGYMPYLGAKNADLYVHVARNFVDVGSLAGYLRANLEWLASTERRSFVGEGARIEGPVRLDATVVGGGATVRGEGPLVRCVVWPGATATAPLEDAVVTAAGISKCT
ncbi:MAG TPA: NDP-sugar synthase [Polyangiaceae bacterium]|jgi:mannose-1-phosphate guanylyltransferase